MKKSYSRRGRLATGILKQNFNDKTLTSLGGLNQLREFVRARGIDSDLRARLGRAKADWATWSLDRIVRLLLDFAFAGLERIYHAEELELDPLLCHAYGVDRLFDARSFYRELRRFADPELMAHLQATAQSVVVSALSKHDHFVLEFDSSVETVYGHQEGAQVGPNPHKPGRASYHPLFARERMTDLVVNHQLRPGDTNSASGAVGFLHRTIDVLRDAKAEARILARLDSGFETDDILSALERRGVGYVVKARATWDVSSTAAALGDRAWKTVEHDGEGTIQVAEFTWRRSVWTRPRRFVVSRRRDFDSVTGHLFDEHSWSYALFVTNLEWAPDEIARFYDKRADVERSIDELKNDLSIDHIPTSSFAANAADLTIKVLARNLLVLYRDEELELGDRQRVSTLRRRFVAVAARVVRHAGRTLLRLAQDSPLRRFQSAALAFG